MRGLFREACKTEGALTDSSRINNGITKGKSLHKMLLMLKHRILRLFPFDRRVGDRTTSK